MRSAHRGPSPSARAVAKVRAGLDCYHTDQADRTGERFLLDSLTQPDRWFADFIERRTQFIDLSLMDYFRGGGSQIVLVGAGYDTRSLRLKKKGTVFYEIDISETQSDKKDRLTRGGVDTRHICFVPCDLANEPFWEKLLEAGFDGGRRTAFVIEGVLLYLPPRAAIALVRELGGVAPAESRLLATFALRTSNQEPQPTNHLVARQMPMRETRQSFFTPSGVRGALAGSGWSIHRTQSVFNPGATAVALFADSLKMLSSQGDL